MKFEPGDKVRMKYQGEYVHGEVTIIAHDTCKVLFDEDWAPDYWYYPQENLELVEKGKYLLKEE